MIRNFAHDLFASAEAQNHRNVLELLAALGRGRVLDLGCDNGAWTMQIGRAAGAAALHGLDVMRPALADARRRGVLAANSDLTQPLPFATATFALVHSNQVIEHLPDVDLFVRSSGEQRTSNFLVWQSAYAEMVFLDTLWPDFDRRDLWRAIEIYAERSRRYGGAVNAPAAIGPNS